MPKRTNVGSVALVALALCANAACGNSKPSGIDGFGGQGGTIGSGGAGGSAGEGGASGAGGTPDGTGGNGGNGGSSCPAAVGGPLGVAQRADEGAGHTVWPCDPVCYRTIPPSSGTHFPYWADYKVYSAPVPWGFLMHSLEHGAIVVVYHPAMASSVDIEAARRWATTMKDTLGCEPPRAIVAPDPTLDVPWAASAWNWTLRADRFDADQFTTFFNQHNGNVPENICSRGSDLSGSGWCPFMGAP